MEANVSLSGNNLLFSGPAAAVPSGSCLATWFFTSVSSFKERSTHSFTKASYIDLWPSLESLGSIHDNNMLHGAWNIIFSTLINRFLHTYNVICLLKSVADFSNQQSSI